MARTQFISPPAVWTVSNGLLVDKLKIGTYVLPLIHDGDVITSDASTGDIIAEDHVDPTEDYR